MMKTQIAVAVTCLAVGGAALADIAAPLRGLWVLESPSQTSARACRMSIEFTADGRVIRTSAELVYTTVASLTPKSPGWILAEQLEGHNGMVSCRGQPAEEVVRHLARGAAYVEVDGATLNYFRDLNTVQPSLRFVRAQGEAQAE